MEVLAGRPFSNRGVLDCAERILELGHPRRQLVRTIRALVAEDARGELGRVAGALRGDSSAMEVGVRRVRPEIVGSLLKAAPGVLDELRERGIGPRVGARTDWR